MTVAPWLDPAGLGRVLAGHRVRRAWPDDGYVVLETTDDGGRVGAGVWSPVVGFSASAASSASADERLPGLAEVLARWGERAQVVGHRLGKRAVLRTPDGFVKVVRPSKARGVARRHQQVAAALAAGTTAGAPTVPRLVDVDEPAGLLTFATLPGAPLRPGSPDALVALRVALEGWARTDVPDGLPEHGPRQEREVMATWVTHATHWGCVPVPLLWALVRAAALADAALSQLEPGAEVTRQDVVPGQSSTPRLRALLHRDLHDGQLLVHRDPQGLTAVGILDLDTACTGDPALDLGNLLTHLDLAAVLGTWTRADVDDAQVVLLAGKDRTFRDRVEVYRLASRVRVVAVHAFRPTGEAVAYGLLGAEDVPVEGIAAGTAVEPDRPSQATVSR